MTPTPCDHFRRRGEALCPECRIEWEEDSTAYEEYGPHEKGRANWAALQAEMAARPTSEATPDNTGIPF